VKKNVKQAKPAAQSIPTGPSGRNGESKIQVSNLPKDVNEQQIKEYFNKSVGPIKRVDISYGPGGISRGIATISFKNLDGAKKAVEALNGLLVDGRPMKIDIILDARRAAAIPPPKGLGDRIAPAKNQPKTAAGKKVEATNGASARGNKKGKKTTRDPRPAKKTMEELDSEMADYFVNGAGADNGGATNSAQTVANGDAAMDDGIM